MIEVTLRIRFTQPSLGAKPTKRPSDGVTVLVMPRTPSGRVMFPPAWWRAIVAHGARVKGGLTSLANKIEWSIELDGQPNIWNRRVPGSNGRRAGCVHHEAFLPGDLVAVDCVLPPGLPPEVFRQWMEAGGKYLGVSPYKHGAWGRFEVVEVAAVGGGQAREASDVVSGSAEL